MAHLPRRFRLNMFLRYFSAGAEGAQFLNDAASRGRGGEFQMDTIVDLAPWRRKLARDIHGSEVSHWLSNVWSIFL